MFINLQTSCVAPAMASTLWLANHQQSTKLFISLFESQFETDKMERWKNERTYYKVAHKIIW